MQLNLAAVEGIFFDLLVELNMKVSWKYAIKKVIGKVFVLVIGISKKLKWYAKSWDFLLQVRKSSLVISHACGMI